MPNQKLSNKNPDYWFNQPWDKNQALPIDKDYNQSDNIVGNYQQMSKKLTVLDTSNSLGSLNGAFNSTNQRYTTKFISKSIRRMGRKLKYFT